VILSPALLGELASVTVALAVAHRAESANWLAGIGQSKFNFDFVANSQFDSHHYTYTMFTEFSATSLSDYGFVGFVKDNSERNVDFVSDRAAFERVRNDLDGHN